MPTIAETSTSYTRAFPALLSVQAHRDAVVRDLSERGIGLRPLAVLAAALDRGLSEDLAVAVAELVEGSRPSS